MSTRIIAIPGQFFDGGIVDIVPAAMPGAPAPPEQPKPELRDLIIEALCALEPDTPELEHQRDLLIGKHLALNSESMKLIEGERGKAIVALREAWEEQKRLCREQQGRIEVLSAKLAEATREWNTAIVKKSAAAMHVFEVTERRKNLSRFATAEQTAKADGAIVKAERAFEEAGKPEAEWRQRRNDLVLTQIPNAKKKLDELAAKELELRASISGESYGDELGIQHPARAPLA